MRKRCISLAVAIMMLLTMLSGMTLATAAEQGAGQEGTSELMGEAYKTFNFKSAEVDGAINVKNTDMYDASKGYGFVKTNSAMPARTVDPSKIKQDENGCSITETDATTVKSKDGNNDNFGGLIFRVDVDKLGGYGITVNCTSETTSSNTWIAPTGMQASRITSSSAWDTAGLVAHNNYASWEGSTWKYDYVTGWPYIEIEIEPNKQPTAAGTTIGIESISLSRIENNTASGKPTVFVLGDSTQKTYTFEEDSMSSWGQNIFKMFDLDKVNVVNYSMGGRSMRANYTEGRFNNVLYNAKEGDFVLIHSAHNDETDDSAMRFGRGSSKVTYPKWLDMYCAAMEERGVTPILVSGMQRTSNGVASVSSEKPRGFNPNSPQFMEDKAKADNKVEFVDLFAKAKAYFEKIGSAETMDIYQSLEAGESPGKTNSGSYANGHPDNKIDGTHYKEAAGKMFSKLIAEDIYAQSAAGSAKIKELAGYLNDKVKAACTSGNWSEVYPENRAKDVTEAKVNGYSASNSKYRNQIEKMLQIGAMDTDNNNLFNPEKSISTNDFIAGICTIWNLETADFAKYMNSGTLNRETMAGIVYDAYSLKFGRNVETGEWNKPKYMTDYNGSSVSPDDPEYDPNLTGESAQYYPLVGWGNLTDTKDISREYLEKFYEVYNLGLMRSEKGLSRTKMMNGTELEPKAEVTRAKAAKELFFLFGLQQNIKTENQEPTVPTNYGGTDKNPVVYKAVNYTAMDYEFSAVDIDYDGMLSVELKYNGEGTPSNKLVVERKSSEGTVTETKKYDVSGSGKVSGLDMKLEFGESVNMYVVTSDADSTKLSVERTAECTNVVIPAKKYTAETAAGIQGGTVALTNLGEISAETAELESAELSSAGEVWWRANGAVNEGQELMPELTAVGGSLTPIITLDVTGSTKATIEGESFTKYVSHGKINGKFENGMITGAAMKFVAPASGVLSLYVVDVGSGKEVAITEEGTATKTDSAYYHIATAKENVCASIPVEAGKTYYMGVLGSKGRFVGISYMSGAPVVSVKARPGETVQIDAVPEAGMTTKGMSVTGAAGSAVDVTMAGANQGTFVMPEENVTIDVSFTSGGETEPSATPDVVPTPEVVPTTEPLGYAYEITEAYYGDDGKLNVELKYNGTEENPTGKLLAAAYDEADSEIMLDAKSYDIKGTTVEGLDYSKPDKGIVKLYIWNGVDTLNPLSKTFEVKDVLRPTELPSATPGPTSEPTVNKATLTQESSGANFEFSTIRDAVAKATELNPQSEAERVVINVDPGFYEEQVLFDNVKYITLQQTPGTNGKVNLSWYYCTGYCAGTADLNGNYDPKINWSKEETWNGYKDTDEKFTKYEVGQVLNGVSTISYYDLDGVAHKDVSVRVSHLGNFSDMAPLVVRKSASDITVKDFNIINSIPVMVTKGEKEAGVKPQADRKLIPGKTDNELKDMLPERDSLSICYEDTAEVAPESVLNSDKTVSKAKYIEKTKDGNYTFTPEESAYLARSSGFNERGHAVSINGDRCILENIRARGNQDSVYISEGRIYFKNCDLIGGTDYIYGNATAVFDNCKLGAAGMTDKDYGATITAANTDGNNDYGYLFYNCELYNTRNNITNSMYGRPWRQDAQITFYNTVIDDNATTGASPAGITAEGWRDMSGNMKEDARFYEYGTRNKSGEAVDFSKRVKCTNGFGSVLDDWQILEFNPINYFKARYKWTDNWDPMNMTEKYAGVNKVASETTFVIPEGTSTEVDLPQAPAGYEFKWESASEYAIVNNDGTKVTVIRPANGETPIETTLVLYIRESSDKAIGTKAVIPVTINPTTDTENVFTATGTISLNGAAPDVDVDFTVNFYKGNAVIKQTSAQIAKGTTSAVYTAEGIPVGEYDVVFDTLTDGYKILNPENGKTTITGAKGESVTSDASVAKLVNKTYSVTGIPTNLGSGATVANNNGEYTVSSSSKTSDGAYWNLSSLSDGIKSTDAVTVTFTVTMEKGYSTSDDCATVDLLSGIPGTYNSDENKIRIARTSYGRWDQMNMLDVGVGRRSGSSNTEHQWLNCAGGKFPATNYADQIVSITANFKTGVLTAKAKVAGADSWNEYNMFTGFPEASNIDRDNLCLAVYPGSADPNKFIIKDITVEYTEFE